MPHFPRHSPLSRQHQQATLLGRSRLTPVETTVRGVLFGHGHHLFFPRVAMVTERELGNVRHALAQRVVAGTFYVDTPFPTLTAQQPKKPSPSTTASTRPV